MRPEAPERVLIVPHPAKVQALAIEVERLADVPGRHQVFHLDDRGVIQEEVAHHETPTALPGDTDQRLGLAGRKRHGLFDQDVLAGFEGPSRLVVVLDRKSTRLNSSHGYISYAVFCLKKKKQIRAATVSRDRSSTTPIQATIDMTIRNDMP